MNVILRQNLSNLGKIGDQVHVKPGYARNYLFPKGIAFPATPEHIAKIKEKFAELAAAAADLLATAQQRAEQLASVTVTIPVRAGDEGKMFGSLGTRDIADAINQAGSFKVLKSEVLLPNGVIRQTGEYQIALKLHSEVDAVVKVVVVPAA